MSESLDQARQIGDTFLGDVFWDDAHAAIFGKASGELNQDYGKVYFDPVNHLFVIESTKDGTGTTRPTVFRFQGADAFEIGVDGSASILKVGGFVGSVDAAAAAVSSANQGRIRYNNTTKTWQSSVDGGAYVDFGVSATVSSWTNNLNSFGSEKKIGTGDNFDFVLYRNAVEKIRIGTSQVTISEPLVVQNAASAITVPYHSYYRHDVNGTNLLGNVNDDQGVNAFCGFEATVDPDATGTFTAYVLVTGRNYGGGHGFSPVDGIFGIGTGATAMRLYTPGTQDIILYPNTTEVGRITNIAGGVYGLRLQRPADDDNTALIDLKNAAAAGIARISWTADVGTAETGITGSAGSSPGIGPSQWYHTTVNADLVLNAHTNAKSILFETVDIQRAGFISTGEFIVAPAARFAEGRFSSSYRVEVIDTVNDIIGTLSWNKSNGNAALASHHVANNANHQAEFGLTSTGYSTSAGIAADEAFLTGYANNVVIAAGGSHNIRLVTNGSVRYQADGDGKMSWFGASTVAQQGPIADASGGVVQDAEARTAINSLLAAFRNYALIST